MSAESHERARRGPPVGPNPPKQGVAARDVDVFEPHVVARAASVGTLSAVAARLDHEVDLWWVALPTLGCATSLGSEEPPVEGRRRGGRMHRGHATGAAVRAVLARYLDCPPASVPLVRGPHGKPQLEAFGSLRFSVSHSGVILAVAVTAGTEIGVDVELIRPVQRDMRLARRWFSEADTASLARVSGALREQRFMELWTRREAIAKLSGEGLWSASPPDTQSATVGTSVLNVDVLPGYAAAVAAAGAPRVVRVLSPGVFGRPPRQRPNQCA